MRFIRKHGHIIPIRESNAPNFQNWKAKDKALYQQHAKASLVSAGLRGVAIAGVQSVGLAGSIVTKSKVPLQAARVASIGVGAYNLGKNVSNSRKLSKESEGRVGGLNLFVGHTAFSWLGASYGMLAGKLALGTLVAGGFKAKHAATPLVKAAKVWSEGVRDNRRFRNAKKVASPISGFLGK